jgi:hypothetical protein
MSINKLSQNVKWLSGRSYLLLSGRLSGYKQSGLSQG